MTATIDERLTTSQAARLAGVTSETIRAWVHDQRLIATKTITGQFRIARSELAKVLGQNPNEQTEGAE